MKKNWTVLFLLLAITSITGGIALESIFEYSPTIGWFIGLLFLIRSAFHAYSSKKSRNSSND